MEPASPEKEPARSKNGNKAPWSKSLFLSAIVPVGRAEKDIKCSLPETVLALALIFVIIALMRFILLH